MVITTLLVQSHRRSSAVSRKKFSWLEERCLSEGHKCEALALLKPYFLCKFGDHCPERAEAHSLLLKPDAVQLGEILSGYEIKGRFRISLARRPMGVHVFIQQAVWTPLESF